MTRVRVHAQNAAAARVSDVQHTLRRVHHQVTRDARHSRQLDLRVASNRRDRVVERARAVRLREVVADQRAVQTVKRPVHVAKRRPILRVVRNAHAQRALVKHVPVGEEAGRVRILRVALRLAELVHEVRLRGVEERRPHEVIRDHHVVVSVVRLLARREVAAAVEGQGRDALHVVVRGAVLARDGGAGDGVDDGEAVGVVVGDPQLVWVEGVELEVTRRGQAVRICRHHLSSCLPPERSRTRLQRHRSAARVAAVPGPAAVAREAPRDVRAHAAVRARLGKAHVAQVALHQQRVVVHAVVAIRIGRRHARHRSAQRHAVAAAVVHLGVGIIGDAEEAGEVHVAGGVDGVVDGDVVVDDHRALALRPFHRRRSSRLV